MTTPTIKTIEVRLDVASAARSADFYVDMLGFEVGTVWPIDSPQFAILNRDGRRRQLGRRADTPATPYAVRTLWLAVSEIDDRHSTIKGKVRIEWGPEVYFYQRREFAFRDPDGHLVILSEATCDPPTGKAD